MYSNGSMTGKLYPAQDFIKHLKTPAALIILMQEVISLLMSTKYIDVAFGYDKNFIGNGYRSLFLSDFGNNNLFLKLNTRIWKFNYQNLFMELHNADMPGGDKLIGKKICSHASSGY